MRGIFEVINIISDIAEQVNLSELTRMQNENSLTVSGALEKISLDAKEFADKSASLFESSANLKEMSVTIKDRLKQFKI